MKDTFIMSKKVFHNETSISNSLASSQPEIEVTLKTPVQYFRNLKKNYFLTLLKFHKETHCRLLSSRK